MFSTLSWTEIIILEWCSLSSANALNLVQSKTLLFGKKLTKDKILDQLKLKAFEYNHSSTYVYVYINRLNLSSEGWKTDHQYFSHFQQCFQKAFFSSPEHNMLRMSYCDRSLSGSVCLSVCPSVNNYLKNLLLWNRPTDFNETSQKWSLGDALSEILQRYEFHKELWLPWQPKEKKLSQTVRARTKIFGM